MKFVDVTNDVAFRKIFGNENKKLALISFLNAVLDFPLDKKVVDVTILNTHQLPALRFGRATIVDVKAKDQNGNTFIVEMQVTESDDFVKRALYYTAQSYTSQIQRGDLYYKLTPVFFIGILAFKATGNPCYINRHKVMDVETGENVITDVDFTFIELPKFNLTQQEVKTIIEQWVYFIKNAENLGVIPENITDEGLKQAFEEADKHAWTKQELEDYDYMFMREQDERGKITLAVRRAEQRGEEIGEKRGEQRGEQRAMEKAAIEKEQALIKAKAEFARKLKDKGMDISFIVETTGLTREEIENI